MATTLPGEEAKVHTYRCFARFLDNDLAAGVTSLHYMWPTVPHRPVPRWPSTTATPRSRPLTATLPSATTNRCGTTCISHACWMPPLMRCIRKHRNPVAEQVKSPGRIFGDAGETVYILLQVSLWITPVAVCPEHQHPSDLHRLSVGLLQATSTRLDSTFHTLGSLRRKTGDSRREWKHPTNSISGHSSQPQAWPPRHLVCFSLPEWCASRPAPAEPPIPARHDQHVAQPSNHPPGSRASSRLKLKTGQLAPTSMRTSLTTSRSVHESAATTRITTSSQQDVCVAFTHLPAKEATSSSRHPWRNTAAKPATIVNIALRRHRRISTPEFPSKSQFVTVGRLHWISARPPAPVWTVHSRLFEHRETCENNAKVVMFQHLQGPSSWWSIAILQVRADWQVTWKAPQWTSSSD